MAGTGGRGELEERLQVMLKFLAKNPDVVAFYDEIHSLLDQKDASSRNIATALKELMANGSVRCIGATTDREYARHIARDPALNSRFTKLLIPEPSDSETAAILKGLAPVLLGQTGPNYGDSFSSDAIRRCVEITARFQRSDRQPRKSIRLMQRAGFEVLHGLRAGEPGRTAQLTAEDVSKTFSEMSDIPLDQLRGDADESSEALAGALRARVRYHAVRLSDAQLDALRWHPWSLDQVLATGIGEDSLAGSNPEFQTITENSPETQVRIDIDLDAAASGVRPVTEYSRAAEAIVKTLSGGNAFYLLESADSSEASGIVSAVLRRCRAESMLIPSVAIELSFVAPKPLRHSLLKVVAAESGNQGSTPEHWSAVSADHLFRPSEVTSIQTADSKSSDQSAGTNRVNEAAARHAPLVVDTEMSPEPNEELLRLHSLLDSREQTSNVLKKELAAALDRIRLLEQQLLAN